MAAVISALIILCCLVIVLAVLVQNPKGGGLASGFQGGTQVMGARQTADFLEKATWTLAVFLFVLSLAATSYAKKSSDAGADQTSTTKDRASEMDTKSPASNAAPFKSPVPANPNAPKPAPAGQSGAPPAKPDAH